jgi:outer membrane protein OmpA-like peptidoglycan-associated protein
VKISRWAMGLTVALCAAGLSACGPNDDEAADGSAAGPDTGDCAKLAEVALPDGAGVTVLVVDNTASGVQGKLPPAIRDALTTAQKAGDRLVIVPVEGTGRPARISRTVALDPAPGKLAQTAINARAIALDCVDVWSREQGTQPTAPGSDILSALTAASQEQPTRILVESDGLANSGEFDLNRDGFDADPTRLAGELAASGSFAPTLKGRTVLWAGLGRSGKAIAPSLTVSLQNLWTALLTKAGAKATFDSRAGGQSPAQSADLPADEVDIPNPTRRTTSCGEQIVVPASLLFSPGSATLQQDTDAVLQQAADSLTAHPDWNAVIEGHTANYDTAAGRMVLSQRRARAVVDAIKQMNIDGARLIPEGYGATKPAVKEFVGGKHDEAAATKNRRVVIELGPKGCVR